MIQDMIVTKVTTGFTIFFVCLRLSVHLAQVRENLGVVFRVPTFILSRCRGLGDKNYHLDQPSCMTF